jgi:hypothetical protein
VDCLFQSTPAAMENGVVCFLVLAFPAAYLDVMAGRRFSNTRQSDLYEYLKENRFQNDPDGNRPANGEG